MISGSLTNKDKLFLIQTAMNTYKGKWGKADWSLYSPNTLEEFNIEPCQGFFAEVRGHEHFGDALVICIRGSDEGNIIEGKRDKKNDDWAYNFDFKLIQKFVDDGRMLCIPYGNDTSDIRMHRGFIEHYALIRDLVRDRVRKALSDGIKNFLVTGHSLGGADTTVCTIDLHYMLSEEEKLSVNENENSIGLVGAAWASPRVGNSAFVKSFNKRMGGYFYNERFSDDPVSKVPPEPLSYQHVAKEKTYENIFSILGKPLFGIIPWAAWYHHPLFIYNAIQDEIKRGKV